MAKWAAEYEAKGFPKVHYQSIGSGAGIVQIKAGTVDFGASDASLRPDELAPAGLQQFPLVITDGSGTVEYAYALQNKLAFALVENTASKFGTPNLASFQAAAASADWAATKDFYLIMTDAPGEGAYPIAATGQPRHSD